MSVNQRLSGFQVRHVLIVGVLTAAAIGPSTPASAAALTYFADGKAYPIERSETEFAIELLPGDSVAAADARLRWLDLGTAARLPWGPADGRFALVRVANADAQTRARVRREGLVRSVRRVYRFHPAGQPHLGSGRLVVKLAEGLSDDAFGELLRTYGVRLVRPFANLARTYVVQPLDPATDEVELASRMHADPRTSYTDPDLISPLFKTQFGGDEKEDILESEEFGPLQWHLRNTGQEGGVIGADINIEEAFGTDGGGGVFGAGVIVGMLDDACDVFHEDLVANYINASHDAATGDKSQTAANPILLHERHGSAMMGLICARRNDIGVLGVAPAARFTASRGAGDLLSASQIAAAFDFALERGVDVHCNSWAGEPGTVTADSVRNSVEEAFMSGRDGLGMVITFPTGNDGIELQADLALAGLTGDQDKKLVIGVGACNARERVTSYSSFGVGVVDVLAPSGDVFLPQIVTTDNTDATLLNSPGYNIGGFDDFDLPNLSNPNYTQGDSFSDVGNSDFFGTSAACAQVTGVAALVMGTTRQGGVELNATQVRAILEHTADRIPLTDEDEGDYNVITGRSLKYGYGRVNAGEAVEAARLVTGSSPFTWPQRVKNVAISDTDTNGVKVLTWEKNDDLREFEVPVAGGAPGQTETVFQGDETTSVLVVQRVGLDFEWVPVDGQLYFQGETVDFEQNVTVVRVGDRTSHRFSDSLGIVYFGVFARNTAGRYSFGVSVNSEGEIVEFGRSTKTGAVNGNGNDNGPDDGPAPVVPTVSIAVSPLSGMSPLKVSFRGNAPESDSPIEKVSWDFGDGSQPVSQPVAEHTYVLSGAETETFTATFSVEDSDGDVGERSVVITVFSLEGADEDPFAGGIRIIVSEPGQTQDLGDFGELGSRVELRVDTSRIVGTPLSIFWNLGDGTTANSFTVSHIYNIAGTFPILATVTARTSSGDTLPHPASRLFTVVDTGAGNNNNNDNVEPPPGNGGDSGGGLGVLCGAGSLLPMLAMLGVVVLRRLRLSAP